MTSEYNDFISFLEKYRNELNAALSNEREKRQALLSSDFERLEAMLQVQQAETMKLKSFENKREIIQTKLGFENYTAKEVVAAIGDIEVRKILEKLFAEIVEVVIRIKEQNKMSIELANTNIKLLDKVFNNPEYSTQNGVYGPDSSKQNSFSKGSALKGTV